MSADTYSARSWRTALRDLKPLGRATLWMLIGFTLGAGITSSVTGAAFVDQVPVIFGYILALIGWLLGIGCWEAYARPWLGLATHVDEGVGRARYWRFNTDHKVVGIQYLVTSLIVLLIAGALAMVMRVELMRPGMQVFQSLDSYNAVMSLHGTLMIFAVAALAIVGGFGNYFVPIMIGAEDMSYPRLNAVSYWFVPMGILAFLAAPFFGGWNAGWTGYAPLSDTNGPGQLLYNLGVITLGLSSIAGAINAISTIVNLRAPGLTWARLPMFVWAMLVTSILNLLFIPFVAVGMVGTILDRVAGTIFYTPQGIPLLYQDLFWVFGHPEVYILILPAIGIVLELLPVFSQKTLYGYRWAVAGFLLIMVMSATVWDHHMFTTGVSDARLIPFMTSTELISIPTGFLYLAALGTLWRANLRFEVPMLFALGFMFNFLIGGLTGVFLADVPIDFHVEDTFFVVAHFHFTIMGGMVFGLMAGLYYWFPKMTGRMYNDKLGRVHFWWMFITFNTTFLPMFWLGFDGMNRRIGDYLPYLANVNMFVSMSAFILGASFIVPLVNFATSLARGHAAETNPWAGKTLEWSTSSPPPKENFPAIPEVVADFYTYGEVPETPSYRVPPSPGLGVQTQHGD